MSKSNDLKTGDKVWYVPSNRRHPNPDGCYLTVTKVGRKLFYIQEDYYVNSHKCRAWEYDGYAIGILDSYPHGTIYKTKQDYLNLIAWRKFERDISKINLTVQQKADILKIANIEVEKEDE